MALVITILFSAFVFSTGEIGVIASNQTGGPGSVAPAATPASVANSRPVAPASTVVREGNATPTEVGGVRETATGASATQTVVAYATLTAEAKNASGGPGHVEGMPETGGGNKTQSATVYMLISIGTILLGSSLVWISRRRQRANDRKW
ncbi:MAG: hypothetical protein ABIQ44_12520 [Chloroflexia bacterium]